MSSSRPNKTPQCPAKHLRVVTLLTLEIPALPFDIKLKVLEQYFLQYSKGVDKIRAPTGEIIAIRFRLDPAFPSPTIFDDLKYVPKVFETAMFQVARAEPSSEKGKGKVDIEEAKLQTCHDNYTTSQIYLTIFDNPETTSFTCVACNNIDDLAFQSECELELLGRTNLQRLRIKDSVVMLDKMESKKFIVRKTTESLMELWFVLTNPELFPDLREVVIESIQPCSHSSSSSVDDQLVQVEIEGLELRLVLVDVVKFIKELLATIESETPPAVTLEPFSLEPVNDFSEEQLEEVHET